MNIDCNVGPPWNQPLFPPTLGGSGSLWSRQGERSKTSSSLPPRSQQLPRTEIHWMNSWHTENLIILMYNIIIVVWCLEETCSSPSSTSSQGSCFFSVGWSDVLMFGACSKKVDKHPGMREAIWGHQPGPGPLIDVNSSGMPWVGDLECWENLQSPCFRTVIFPKLYGRKCMPYFWANPWIYPKNQLNHSLKRLAIQPPEVLP